MKKNPRPGKKPSPLEVRELKRRRRERIIMAVTFTAIVVLAILESHLFRQETLLPFSSNIVIFALININVALIILLIFLIVRNLVKLINERRRRIMGSKLRTKLVAAFVSLSLIPTAILFLVATNFLSYSIESWFSMTIGDALTKTVEVAQVHYQQTADQAKFFARQIAAEVTNSRLYDRERADYLRVLVEQRRKSYQVSMIEVYFDNQKEKLIIRDLDNPAIAPATLSPKSLEAVYVGKEVSTVTSMEGGDLISGLAPVYSYLTPTEVVGIVIVNYFLPKSFVDNIDVISKTSEQYRQFKLLKNPIKFSYIITLFVVTLLIIFSATWFGLFLAKGITVPIQNLAEATARVARGDLNHQLDKESDDEIGLLVQSFNQMTRDLKKSSENLEGANQDLEQRRRYMEAVLRYVSAGVISVDRDGVITTINQAAESLLEIKTSNVLNKRYEEVLVPDHLLLVNELLSEMRRSGEGFIEKQVELMLKDRLLTLLMTLTVIRDDAGGELGMVLVFEDLTQIQRAERVAAWREVARRIAHDIKNPLTPVQLSAQRLQKRYGDKLGAEGSVFHECTRTIINQVEVLKKLVDEFSQYARMPVTKLTVNSLNDALADPVVLFQDAHREVAIDFHPQEGLPRVYLDPAQMRRVMVNLLDNAIAAVSPGNGRIVIRTSHDTQHRRVRVEVADNGRGVPAAYKMKMFEPYYSTKGSGTGLGLAIVSSIITDHHGHVSVRDNVPQGTVVAFELPVPEETA